MKRRKNGFTLMELIIVFVILGTIIGFLILLAFGGHFIVKYW